MILDSALTIPPVCDTLRPKSAYILIPLPTILITLPNEITIRGKIVPCVLASSFRNLSASFIAHWVKLLNLGSSLPPIIIWIPSNLLPSNVKSPAKLSSIRLLIFSALPFDVSMAFDNFINSSSLALTMANRPAIPVFPAIASAFIAFSASVIWLNAFLSSRIVSLNETIEPSAFVVSITYFPNCLPLSSIAPTVSVIIFLNAVPAWDALIPLLAIRPIASAVSSIV